MSFAKKIPVGSHIFKIREATVKAGKKDPDSSILHLTFVKVDEEGNSDEGFKPIKEYLGVNHGNKKYMDISSKKADSLLRKLGVEDGLAEYNGDISVLASKEFLKDFMFESFEADIYKNKKVEKFEDPKSGQTIEFQRHLMALND